MLMLRKLVKLIGSSRHSRRRRVRSQKDGQEGEGPEGLEGLRVKEVALSHSPMQSVVQSVPSGANTGTQEGFGGWT